MEYIAKAERYETMKYNRCGKSGLLLPALSLGLWHNFGNTSDFTGCREMLLESFDRGITHFDLANNYGPEAGSAEETFGRVMTEELKPYRDEMIISTKAGYYMWPGPYGEWGSKKNLVASLDQSLKRMKLDYVDIFYAHRYDPETPLEETAGALVTAVRSGKALYAGISKFPAEQARQMCSMLGEAGVPCLVHQIRYNMFNREPEKSVFQAVRETGTGCAAFSPLAQGMLTDRYLEGIPEDSRAAGSSVFLTKERVLQHGDKIRRLAALARSRGQSLAQMALAWVLKDPVVTTALIGASRPSQIRDCLKALDSAPFTPEELSLIDADADR